MPAPPNCVFTIFAFIAFFLCVIRFPMQLHAWNVGTHLFLGWVGAQCLILGINSIVWNHNTVNWAPVWCDISSRIGVGVSVAVPAAVLSINRRLYLLASPTSVLPSEANKRREIMIDFAIGIGLPIIGIILSFFAQGSRFLIVEDFGCDAAIFPSWVAIVVGSVPPIILELIAGVYGCLSIRAFYKRRSHMKELLSSHRSLNPNRYIRLMCFSFCDLVVGIPFTVFYLYLGISSGLLPFPGLKQEHYHFSHIVQVPAVVWRSSTISELSWELNRWIFVWISFVFFAIFGINEESRKNYRAALQVVVHFFIKRTRIKRRPARNSEEFGLNLKSSTGGNLPVDSVNSDIEFSVIYIGKDSTVTFKQ